MTFLENLDAPHAPGDLLTLLLLVLMIAVLVSARAKGNK